jgi:hypothetical protein
MGCAVADTVDRLRIANGLTFAGLSDLTAQAGHRIPPLGIRRIRDHQRYIDVDDLIALAAALHTTPSQLMDRTAAENYRTDCLRWLLAESEHGDGE